MPSFRIPLQVEYAEPDPAGPIRRFIRARVPVSVQIAPGRLANLPFAVIDTGATYTSFSATLARAYGIPFPVETSQVGMNTAAGSRPGVVHDGELRVQFPALPAHTFRLYCVFAELIPPTVPLVFGLNDFLDVFRVTFDGRFSPDAPAGHMLLETD